MWPYWLMFMIPAVAAVINSRQTSDRVGSDLRLTLNRRWGLVGVLTLLIGFRHQVGGDWGTYEGKLQDLSFSNLTEVFAGSDPGYRLLEFLSVQNDWGIYGVNLIGAFIFSFGLATFCRSLPRPWLALSVAVPYLIIVVGMGYTRQGIAIGLSILGMVALGQGSVRKFVFWVLLGVTFHKSAVLLLPIAALAATRKRWWNVFWIVIIFAGAYLVFLEKSVDSLYANYIEAEYQSQGALVRLLMNAVPAIILLVWKKRFEMSLPQVRLWHWFSIISLALFGVYFLTPASTAVDRVALYMLPLQLAIFSYVPEVFGSRHHNNKLFVLVVVLYYAAVLFVWLNFATHSRYWVPYQNWLFL